MKTILLHYHLFKNAGTSLDASLKENFSEKNGEWVTKEFPGQPALNRAQLKQWIIDNPQAICFSTHTAIFPVPKIDTVKIFPIIFMRHPIDRIASAYAFERKQGGDGFGSVLARSTNLSGYIETRLSLANDRQCRNFHMQRFASMFGAKLGDEFVRAKKAIAELPFVGCVERYSESLERLERLLGSEGVCIELNPVERNVSRNIKKSLDDRLNDIRKEIGDEVYSKLELANSEDKKLYDCLLGVE
ncbi:sulfotransferase family 2 domain-containing protein [Amphritea japonica]|uniref:Sulfotransferase family protein n=1 Tax=Amphritea japonica ATCC BAA-1530 TaxID=1278309 RepID=A0A7R6PIK8_9GAMM|nr:sulfotransferase family 2 domain-containing protein [Amphritea japonica]BBB25100.1 conserved hypothetical protein [Amphritea japonica ATCC BAA-1530]